MRRKIAPYSTRIAIDYSKIYGAPDTGGPYFVCMSESDIELVVKVFGYARRRINWAYNLTDSAAYYQGLTDEEWESVNDNLDDLEGRFMAVVCQQDIVDAIVGLQECLCSLSSAYQIDRARLPDMMPWVDEGSVTAKREDETLAIPAAPGSDEEKCEEAQAVYYKIFETYTEVLLPFANDTADVLVTALVAATAFEALAGFLGLPLAVITGIVAAVVAWGVDGAIASFTNWLLANKDELVCELYNNLPDYAAAAAAVGVYIDDAEGITWSDKLVLKTMFASEWWITWVILDQQTNGTWDDYMVPGQCDDCAPVDPECSILTPCDTDRWFTTYPPVCVDGEPTCWAGQVVWDLESTLTPTAASGNRFECWIKQKGGAASATYTIKLRYPGPPANSFTVATGTVLEGETKHIEATFSTPQPGEPHQIQWTSSPYQTAMLQYCIRPPL